MVDRVLIIICTMGGASHGSSRPVRTFPFDLITLNHFAHIFHFFSWLFNLLYVTCVMVNKAVKKKDQPSILFPFAKEVKTNTFN